MTDAKLSSGLSMERLLQEMLEQSRKRALAWYETQQGQAFGFAVDRATVTITAYPGGQYDDPTYELALRDASGRTIDALHSDTPNAPASALQELFLLARDKALGVTDLMQRVLSGVQAGKVEKPSVQEEKKSGFDGIPF